MSILRAALYERVSTEEQAMRGFSIDAQMDNLTDYCNRNNLKIVGHYTDEGISGAKPPLKRPSLKRLLDDVESGRIDIVLFTKLDRWFRSVKEYFKVQDILDKYKVEWKAIHEDYDTSTANGRMAITIFLAIAQNEREKTAERIKVVFEHKRKNREACFGGGVAPLGYKKERDSEGVYRLVKDPDTEQAVQDFWNVLLSTHSLHKAIRHMDNVYDLKKDWQSWARMSRSEFYYGSYRGIDGYCEPYISKEDFQKYHDGRPTKATPTGRTYLFRGMIRCPECGAKMIGNADVRQSGEYKLYRCRNRLKTCKNGGSISEKKIEKQLLANINEFLKDEIAAVELEVTTKSKPKVNINALKEKRRRLTVAYMAGNLSDDDYLSKDSELKTLISNAESENAQKPRNIEPLKKLLEVDFASLYKTLDDEERQRFWRELIQEIVIEDRIIKKIIFF